MEETTPLSMPYCHSLWSAAGPELDQGGSYWQGLLGSETLELIPLLGLK